MNYVDIVIIAIVAFAALWGLWKSCMKTLVKLLCFALAIVGTYLISNMIVNWMLSIKFINGLIVGEGFSLRALYYSAIGEEGFNIENMGVIMQSFVKPMLDRFASGNIGSIFAITEAQFVAINLAINTLNVILCVLIYSLLRLAVMIIAWLLEKILVHGKPNFLSRIFGFAFGAVRGVAFAMVVLIASTTIFPFEWSNEYADSVGKSVIGNTVSSITYQVYDWAAYGTDADKTIKLLSSAGIEFR